MADGTGLTDEVIVALNELDDSIDELANEIRLSQQEPTLPSRPADSAAKAEWVDYCVALGADRSIGEDTQHWEGDKDTGQQVTVKGLTKAELVKLADRLGG